MSFTVLNLHPHLLAAVRELGFERPTPIQAEVIPAAMSGRDLLASAQTGSGKTAAFLLPILHRLMGRPRGTTRALVLTPTRELAAQILKDVKALALRTPVTAAAIYGGVGMRPQEQAFRRGVDVITATPGRLLDHCQASYAKLSGIEYLVLDEADRMLDMGFLPDVRRILRHIPAKRQTLFLSATMPTAIAQLASDILTNPVSINLQRESAPPAGITHAVYPVSQAMKATLLLELLRRNVVRDVLVFTRTKHRADRLTAHLVRNGIKAERIHGNRSQSQRTQALAGFKARAYRVLVATDIAARGIDVEALGHVVNFDVPAVPEDYIHRVGRTGRASATGDALTFSSPEEKGDLHAIERAIRQTLPRLTLPDFDYQQAGQGALEVPREERIRAIRAQRAQARAKAAQKKSRPPGAPSQNHGSQPRPLTTQAEWRSRAPIRSGPRQRATI